MNQAPRELVHTKIGQLFPDVDPDTILAILDQHGHERYHKEPDRVKLAILKLSGGDQAKLQKYVQAASEDYRDVLAWAEYPNQMRTSPNDAEAMRRAKQLDQQQYQLWLRGNGRGPPPA